MRVAKIYFKDKLAGELVEDHDGYTFTYSSIYLEDDCAQPVSLILPLRAEPYCDRMLMPFFDGLIPEGWLLDIAENNWKIDRRDRMSLLLVCCSDCIGAVSVKPKNENSK